LRFSIAAVFLLPVFLRNPGAIAVPRLLALALSGGLGYSLFVYAGFSFAPASHAGVLVNGGAVGVFILAGAAALVVAGLSMIVLAAGLLIFDLVYQKAEKGLLGPGPDGSTNLHFVIRGVADAFNIDFGDAARMLVGAAALIVAGISMIVLSVGILLFSVVYDKAKSLLTKGGLMPIIGDIADAFDYAGERFLTIALGGISLVVAAVALIVLGVGLFIFNAAYQKSAALFAVDDKGDTMLMGAVGGIADVFDYAGEKFLTILVGGVALIFAGVALIALGVGVAVMSSVWKKAGDAKLFDKPKTGDYPTNLEMVVGSVANSFAQISLRNIGKIYLAAPAIVFAGLALMTVATGLDKFNELVKKKIDLTKIDDMVTKVISVVAETFKKVGEDEAFWKGARKGIAAISDVGGMLVSLADGISKMADLKFPIYGKDGKVSGYYGIGDAQFAKVTENIQKIIQAIGGTLIELGKSQGEVKWFSKSDAQKGKEAIQGVGQDLVGIADFVIKVADLRLPKYDDNGKVIEGQTVELKPADLAPGGKIRTNIINMITAITDAFAAVGSGKAAQAGWFSKSDIQKGKEAIQGAASDVANMAQAAKNVADIKDWPNTKIRITEIVKLVPSAIVDAFNYMADKVKGTSLQEMSASLESAAGPVSAFVDVLAKYQEKKITPQAGAGISSAMQSVLAALAKPLSADSVTQLGAVTGLIERLGAVADPIGRLADSFAKLTTSIDKFAGAFKKMDKDVLKNSDMLIQSLVLFAKVDPAAFDATSVKGQELIKYIYDKSKPAQKPADNSVPPAVTAPLPQGTKEVASPNKPQAPAAPDPRQVAMEQTLQTLQTTMAQLVTAMTAVQQALTNPKGLKVQGI
jgi:hypothetical protein